MSSTRLTVLDREEILTRWKLLHGWEPLSCGVCGGASDVKTDEMLAARIDAWLWHCLTTMPASSLPVDEIAGECSVESFAGTDGAGGYVSLRLPGRCVRVVSVRLSGWSCPAVPVTDAKGAVACRQLNPFSAATAALPVAIDRGDELHLYPAAGAPLSVRAVMLPPDGIYRLTPAMLADMAVTPYGTEQ